MSSTHHLKVDQLVPGGWLHCRDYSYKVLSVLGQGTIGKVAKCTRTDSNKTVAVKMIKNEGNDGESAKEEIAILQKLSLLDSEKCNLVQWNHSFIDYGYMCLEFEHLDKSLYDFMKERHFRPLHLHEIRPIVQQLANALQHLQATGIIHADLKVENVMLVNHLHEPFKVKVIDFGLACDISTAYKGSYIQSRFYRSPEVILGLRFTEAIDMWSLGCIAAFLYLGTVLYPGDSEYDMMRYIVETQGQPPDNILDKGFKSHCFFKRDITSVTSVWRLKSQKRFYKETGIKPKETRLVKLNSLDELPQFQHTVIQNGTSADRAAEKADLLTFVDMLTKMLHLDASERMPPHQMLEHQFITMCHIEHFYSNSSYVMSCFQMMSFCPSYTLPSEKKSTAAAAVPQPASRVTQKTLPRPVPVWNVPASATRQRRRESLQMV